MLAISACDDVAFHAVDRATERLEVRDRVVADVVRPDDLEDDPSRRVLDVRASDVGDDVEALHDLVDQWAVDKGLGKGHEEAKSVVVAHRAPSVRRPTRAHASEAGSTKPVMNGPKSA